MPVKPPPTTNRGLPMNYEPFATRAELMEDLAARYEAGATVRELVELRQVCLGSVRNLLAEAGVVMRSRGYRRPPSWT